MTAGARTLRPLSTLLVLLLAACGGEEARAPAVDRDWTAIQERDTLVALTTFNSTSYFIYRGEPMGFEYELLAAFAGDHDLALRTVVVRDRDELVERLDAGEGDLIAARMIPTPRLQEEVAFTEPLYRTRPAVVQRSEPAGEADLPEAVDTVLDWTGLPEETPAQVRARLIGSPADLAGQEVHVAGRSPYRAVLVELSDTLTGDITIVELEGDSATDALVRQVARGEIELAVSHENVARLNSSYYDNLEVRPAIGPTHRVAWALRRGAPELRGALDAWIAEKTNDGTIERLYQKYFVDRRGFSERVESEYLTSTTGRLSDYDPLFKRHAPRIGWDWRLLAAQAFQESRLDPNARSWAGAQGLLQIMPGTAGDLGIRNVWDPEENVDGAVRYLDQLAERWSTEIPDSTERLKFVLASYNTGPGHVDDARRLTEKNGGDTTRWDDVAFWLLQKSKREVYTDPVVRYGFSRGLEPVTYVRKILDRYEHYRQFVVSGGGDS